MVSENKGNPFVDFLFCFALCFFLYMFFYKRMHIISGLTIVYRHHGEDVGLKRCITGKCLWWKIEYCTIDKTHIKGFLSVSKKLSYGTFT
jgi:hypothetical protein